MTFRKISIWFALLPSLLMANESNLSMEIIPDIGLSTFQVITKESKESETATNKITSWNERLQRSLEEMGITFPKGARVTYNPLAHSLQHYNTKENHDRLNRLVSYRSDDSRTQIQIDAHFVMKDGSTQVTGGMLNPKGDAFTYFIFTATIVGPNGTPANEYAGEPVPQH